MNKLGDRVNIFILMNFYIFIFVFLSFQNELHSIPYKSFLKKLKSISSGKEAEEFLNRFDDIFEKNYLPDIK